MEELYAFFYDSLELRSARWLTMKVSRTTAALLAIALSGMFVLTAYMSIASSYSEGMFSRASDIPWAGALVSYLEPDGEVFAKVHYSASRDHHFIQVYGQCDPSSFDAFCRLFGLQQHQGKLWNERFIESISRDNRGDFVFSDDDTGFTGNVKLKGGEPASVGGAYSRSKRRLFLEITSTRRAD